MRGLTQVGKSVSGIKKPEPYSQPNRELVSMFKGGGVALIGQASGISLKYFTYVLVARVLGVEQFGLYALGLIIYRLAVLLAGMGLENGATRFVSVYHRAGDLRRVKGMLLQAIGLPFLGGLFVSCFLFFGAEAIAQDVFAKPELAQMIRILSVAIPFGATMSVAVLATTGFKTARYLVFVRDTLQPFVNLMLIVLLLRLDFGLNGVVLAWVGSVLLGMVVALYCIHVVFPGVTQKHLRPVLETSRLLRFSLPLVFGELTWSILLWADVLMVAYFRPVADVGIYRAASQTALLLVIFLASLNTIFAPLIAELSSNQERDRMDRLFKTATRWSFALTLPLYSILVIAGRDLLHIFGAEFEVGWLPLVILGMGQLINAGTGGVGYALIMSGNQYSKLLGDLVLTLTNLALNLILIPRWGLVGAASAMTISISTVNVLRGVQVHNALQIHAYDRGYLKVIGACVIGVLCGSIAHYRLSSAHFLLRLLVTIGIVLLVYVPLLWRIYLSEIDQFISGRLWKRSSLSQT